MSPVSDDSQLSDAVQALGVKVDALQGEVRRLGAGAALPRAVEEPEAASFAWLASLEAPARRPPQVPRLLLECLFLGACAVAAGVAELDAVAIAGVMLGAWILVALIEWAATKAEERRDAYVAPTVIAVEPPDDPAWFVPPVEHTILETDSITAITRLPPPPPDDGEATIEHRPSASTP